jgi:TPR repeat protein
MRYLVRLLPMLAILLSPVTGLGAELEKGMAAYDVGDYETSMTECQPLADAGVAAAQFCVGRLYANGFGVPMNDAQALHWYGAAADQGYAEAQYNLGVMNANGWGVEMNDEVAANYYRGAAEQGFVPAVLSLAEICQRGMGVEQNIIDAYAWYSVAAQLGDLGAEISRDEIADRLSQDDLQSAQQLAQDRLDAISAENMHAGRGK